MLDFGHGMADVALSPDRTDHYATRSLPKFGFDLIVSLMLLVPLLAVAMVLIVLNPFLNAGPLIYRQSRMGQGCRAFTAYKFRSMTVAKGKHRGAFDMLEQARISRFGLFLRKTRLDELPQVINILRGEMSLIGPRPDSFDHACVYLRHVPGYADRHRILPGISGFAQTEVGYVEGYSAIQRKVDADLYYVKHLSFAFDLWIAWRTICVIIGRQGS